jgi:hypothetical protein
VSGGGRIGSRRQTSQSAFIEQAPGADFEEDDHGESGDDDAEPADEDEDGEEGEDGDGKPVGDDEGVATSEAELEQWLENQFATTDQLLHSQDIMEIDVQHLRAHLLNGTDHDKQEYRAALHGLLAVIEVTQRRVASGQRAPINAAMSRATAASMGRQAIAAGASISNNKAPQAETTGAPRRDATHKQQQQQQQTQLQLPQPLQSQSQQQAQAQPQHIVDGRQQAQHVVDGRQQPQKHVVDGRQQTQPQQRAQGAGQLTGMMAGLAVDGPSPAKRLRK